MNKALKNIENIQSEVKNDINDLLLKNGYSLVKEGSSKDYLDFSLMWFNIEKNHTIYLDWDIRDRWFVLKEYDTISDLKYCYSADLALFPFDSVFKIFRKRYNENYILKIKIKVQEILSKT
jgi:hypothetical protein